MKHTTKLILLLLLTAILCVAIACLCACANGADGINGKDGQNGQDGTNGKSAYQIWLDNGHTGSENDFFEWLKGGNGNNGADGADGKDGLSAYDIFMQQYPYYRGTEEQWMIDLVNGQLRLNKITFKSEVADDTVKYVVGGYDFTDIPAVPEKEGQTSAKWDVTEFNNVTQDLTVNAVYDMRKYVTFRNEFTDDEDVTITVNYGEAITDIPQITAKAYNNSKWSIEDFSRITTDLQVRALYETQGLQFTAMKQQTEYRVSNGEMDSNTEELFVPAEYEGKPVTVIDAGRFSFVNDTESKIKSIYIPQSIKEIRGGSFDNCYSIKRVYVDNLASLFDITGDGYRLMMNGRHLYINKELITELTVPDTVTEIKPMLFYGWTDLTKVIIPDSVASIGGNAFSGCSSLTSIKIPDSVTSIGEFAFSGCSSLVSITIPDSVTSIGARAFSDCSSLTSIAIPKNVRSIGFYIISGCTNIETVYWNATSCSPMGDGGVLCGLDDSPKLTKLVIGDNVKNIPSMAFHDCKYIINVSIPYGVESMGPAAFGRMDNLKTITIPNSVMEIGDWAFYGCLELTSVNIPESVYKIGTMTFEGCHELLSIVIPLSVKTIEKDAFSDCYNLETVYFKGTAASFNSITIDTGNENLTDVLYYYSETEPTSDGYYWHYDLDGTTPIVWVKEN